MGWQVLQEDYRAFNLLDGASLEWDYYSIHDNNGHFTGIIGYLVADPEGKLGAGDDWWELNLMPSGGNLAINGRWKDNAGNYSIGVNYINFGLDIEAGVDERYWYAAKDSGEWGLLQPENDAGMHLLGETADFSWDLHVTQMWGKHDYPNDDLFEQTFEIGNDVAAFLEGQEHWTVNPLWLSTHVTGTMTNKITSETYPIDGHGYRENSFGRWIFIGGGWDFYFHSDPVNRVGFGFQTYHYNTEDLDFLDVTFMDNGVPKAVRFKAQDDELGWSHNEWTWNAEAKQAAPKDIHIIGKNAHYTVDATATIVRMENGKGELYKYFLIIY